MSTLFQASFCIVPEFEIQPNTCVLSQAFLGITVYVLVLESKFMTNSLFNYFQLHLDWPLNFHRNHSCFHFKTS